MANAITVNKTELLKAIAGKTIKIYIKSQSVLMPVKVTRAALMQGIKVSGANEFVTETFGTTIFIYGVN